MKIKSYVGGHDINVYKDCKYNKETRKYYGGTLCLTIPFSGKMLSANISYINDHILMNGSFVPIKSTQEFIDVDSPPNLDECDYIIVSSLYVCACKSLGISTANMLTIGDVVIDDNGNVIGCMNFIKN